MRPYFRSLPLVGATIPSASLERWLLLLATAVTATAVTATAVTATAVTAAAVVTAVTATAVAAAAAILLLPRNA